MLIKFKNKFIFVGIILFYLLITYILQIRCPIRFFLGISCPGCGMTRSWLQVLQLNFTKAFYYHPLFSLVPFMGVVWLLEDFIKPKWSKIFWIFVIILFILVYIIRFMNPDQNIVSFDPEESVFYRLYTFIKNSFR